MNLSCLSGLSCANMFPGNLQNNLDLNSFGGSWWCAHQEAIHLSSVPSSCWHCIICWFCSEIPSTLTTNLLLLSTDTEMLSYSSPLDLLAMYASVLLKNHFPSLKVLFTKSPNHRVYLHMIWWDIARNQTVVVNLALGDNQFFKKMNNFFEWIIFKFFEWIFCWIIFL